MKIRNPDLNNFIKGALGYSFGAVAGFVFLYLLSRLGMGRWLFGLIEQNQLLLQVLGIPLIAGFMLSLGGAIMGGMGGWSLARILRLPHRSQVVGGSALAYATTTGLFTLVFLLLIGLIALYNNLTTNRIEHYGTIAGLFGLIFGTLTGILQALMIVRLRHSWRIILAALLGFTFGGVILGLLVRLVNPTEGFKTYPFLTWLVLVIGLLAPIFLGGGITGLTLGRLQKLAANKDDPSKFIQPSKWQTGIVAILGLVLAFGTTNFLDSIFDFLTINPANLQSQLESLSVGVQWTPAQTYAGDVDFAESSGNGTTFTDTDGSIHHAKCSPQSMILYSVNDEVEEQIKSPLCSSEPVIAKDSSGKVHIIWYTQELRDTNGITRPVSALVESIRSPEGWSEAAIVSDTAIPIRLSLTLDSGGNLILVWDDENQSRFFTAQETYACDSQNLSDLGKVGLDVILKNGFRAAGEEPAYCRNQFGRLLYTPNPEPDFSDQPITPDGAYDHLADLVDTAEYEILFTTMQYDPADPPPSPGSVLAKGVDKLYQKVKANPESYPRGMTVRILLGNYPEISNFTWGDQIYAAISDIRAAGVEKMVDPEIGWRLEVANFAGTYPHSHTKFMVIDGKTVVGFGYNYGYLHLPKDHPSGRGFDLFDLGMQITGPIAQDALSAYDDMWSGANQIHCDEFYPLEEDWTQSCEELRAVSDHVPEVLRTYLPSGSTSNAFSLYRTAEYKEGDQFIRTSLAAAEDTIDLIHVNFSLKPICMANLIFPDLCDFDNALPWMDAILEAITINQVRVRAIVENTNSNGLENRIGGQTLIDKLESLGLEDLIEIRFFNGKLHAKSTLIDGILLIIGSQNMHYSSWGESGLTEYSLATDDPAAIQEYQAMFESKWEEAIPFKEAEFGTSP